MKKKLFLHLVIVFWHTFQLVHFPNSLSSSRVCFIHCVSTKWSWLNDWSWQWWTSELRLHSGLSRTELTSLGFLSGCLHQLNFITFEGLSVKSGLRLLFSNRMLGGRRFEFVMQSKNLCWLYPSQRLYVTSSAWRLQLVSFKIQNEVLPLHWVHCESHKMKSL